jgi:hypothetical protein
VDFLVSGIDVHPNAAEPIVVRGVKAPTAPSTVPGMRAGPTAGVMGAQRDARTNNAEPSVWGQTAAESAPGSSVDLIVSATTVLPTATELRVEMHASAIIARTNAVRPTL